MCLLKLLFHAEDVFVCAVVGGIEIILHGVHPHKQRDRHQQERNGKHHGHVFQHGLFLFRRQGLLLLTVLFCLSHEIPP